MINFSAVKCELSIWQHTKDSASFKETLKSNRIKKLETLKIIPHKKATREQKLKIQEAKTARQISLLYSTYEIFKAFYQLEMTSTFPQLYAL